MQTLSGGNNNVIKDSTFHANSGLWLRALLNTTGNSISNSIFWGDSVGEIFNDGLSSFSAEYSDFEGGGVAGTGNISGDPLFLGAPCGPAPRARPLRPSTRERTSTSRAA